MNTGSISSKESDVNNVQDDDKLPALPLAMRSDDPILDTYDAWQRDITSMPPLEFPGMKDPPPLTFLHRHTSFETLTKTAQQRRPTITLQTMISGIIEFHLHC
jgi:hypothetical protein